MKNLALTLLFSCIVLGCTDQPKAQTTEPVASDKQGEPAEITPKVVTLKYNPIPAVEYKNVEKEYYSERWANPVITNVSEPTMLVYEPSEEKRNGTALILSLIHI